MTFKWKLIRQFHDEEHELIAGTNTIGRGINSHVRCPSLFVSRTHCIIEISDDVIKIIDNKSSNGTYINHHQIPTDTHHTLNNNDIIGLGISGEFLVSEEFFVFKLILDQQEILSEVSIREKRPLEDQKEILSEVSIREKKPLDDQKEILSEVSIREKGPFEDQKKILSEVSIREKTPLEDQKEILSEVSIREKTPFEDQNEILSEVSIREKRPLEDFPDIEKIKRLKVEEEIINDGDEDDVLLNYTQSDNDVIEISDDENCVAQVFEKSFKSILESPVRQHSDACKVEIDDYLPDDNNDIICIDSDNEEDEVDKWISKLSQNYSFKEDNQNIQENSSEEQIKDDEIKVLPLSQNLLKMIEEDALASASSDIANSEDKTDGSSLRCEFMDDLEEFDFIADCGNLPEVVDKPVPDEPSKKSYVKPPIIEAPHLPRGRRKSSGSNNSSFNKKEKAPKTKKSPKKKSKASKSSKKKDKQETLYKSGQVTDKNDKKIINSIRKDRLKELADKMKVQTEKSSSPRIVSKPKVKLTEKNRGSFLTDIVEKGLSESRKSKSKTKIADLPRIPKKVVQHNTDNSLNEDKSDSHLISSSKLNEQDKESEPSKAKNSELNVSMSNMHLNSNKNITDNISNNCVTPKENDKQLKDISNVYNPSCNIPVSKAIVIKSCLKSAEKPKNRRSVQIKVMPKIRYFEIEEGNKLNRCNVKDLPLNWHEKKNKKSLPAICAQTAAVQSVDNIDDIIALITTWNPLWLEEQKTNPMLPPLLEGTNYKRSLMLHSYTDYSDYERTIIPPMIDELWASVSKEWESRNLIHDVRQKSYSIGIDQIISTQQLVAKSKIMIIHGHMILNKSNYEAGVHPREGDYIIMGLVLNSEAKGTQSSNVKSTTNVRKRFAFVNNVKKVIAKKQVVNQSLLNGTKAPYGILYLELKTKCKPLNLNMKEPMIAYIVSYINPIIRNFKAVLALPNSLLYDIILSPKIEKFNKPCTDDSNCVNMINDLSILNQAQKKAVMDTVADCLLSKPMITLIQGPPGTGKSRVIVNMIQQLLYGEKLRVSKRPKILICAPSNAAIDEIVCRLLDIRQNITANKFKMVRFGVLESMHPKVQDISLQTLSERDVANQISKMKYDDSESLETEKRFLEAKVNSLKLAIENMVKCNQSTHVVQDKLNKCERKLALLGSESGNISPYQHAQMKRESQRLILCGADIICTTLASCVNGQMLSSKLYFNICIVDEATQCTEPETLMPLMLGISKLILVGDPQQLPATVISQSAKKSGFQRSLFSRIESCLEHESFSPIRKLIIQYRMHPDICHFPNRFFYGGSLLSFKPANDSKNTLQPYAVFGLSYLQHPNFSNIKEAEFVINLAALAIRLTSQIKSSVGIITPYQNQKAYIINQLKQKSSLFENRYIDVNTIDSIQGQERDIIIISLVRSDGVGFLADFERLNVALTRAKQSLFVCGNFTSLKKHELWNAFMKDAQDRNFFREAQNLSPSNYDKVLNLIAK